MSLEHGFDPGYGAYSTGEEYRAVWELHRARFMTRFDWGIRPQAWWDFEAPKLGVQQPREYEYEKATLWENGLLTPAENRPAGSTGASTSITRTSPVGMDTALATRKRATRLRRGFTEKKVDGRTTSGPVFRMR